MKIYLLEGIQCTLVEDYGLRFDLKKSTGEERALIPLKDGMWNQEDKAGMLKCC